MDVLTPQQRQKNMRSIRGRKTKPERIIALGLHSRGYRYRLNVKSLQGSPDLVFRKHHAIIFVHGCFWHGHDCHLFKVPATRTKFWLEKVDTNKCRDLRNVQNLLNQGWRILIVWECALRGRSRLPNHAVMQQCEVFLHSDTKLAEIKGVKNS
ncbi:very short patch repair endonuclease [Pseudovibrio sp. JE062]|uniref:very short patch repair endonuclease n=1 Tax=Pseudovibrio sp. JE062 TaxID=439495 RepID=UPI0009FC8A39|nr:very short patch repair endonuclease [Pseudovibrio sp. JE062]